MSNSRAEIRHEVGYRLSELYQGTVSGGSVTSITDSNLADSGASENDHEGAWVVMSGNNSGVSRRVVSYERGTGTLTLHAALPSQPTPGETFELHSLVNPDDINRAINWTLRRMTYPTDIMLEIQDGTIDTISLNPNATYGDSSVPAWFNAGRIVAIYRIGSGATSYIDEQLEPIRWWKARDTQWGQIGTLITSQEFTAGDWLVIRCLAPYDEMENDDHETYAPLDWLVPGVLAELYTLMARKAPAQDAERFDKVALREAANFTAATLTYAPRPPRKVAQHGYPGARRGMRESGV